MLKLTAAAAMAAILTLPTLAQADGNWTGIYAGAQVGASDLSVFGIGDTGTTYGLHLGYDHDMGSFVLGGELDYSTVEYNFLGVTGDVDTTRVKLKGGYDAGRTLVYGVLGYVDIDAGTLSEGGYTLGIGMSFKATDHILIGAEILHDSIDVQGIGIDVDSFNFRVSYKF